MRDIEESALEIVRILTENGHITYFAGGFVRDLLMQHPSDDIDIATTASTSEIEALFEKTIPVGVQFGIIIVVLDGHQFEIATFRKEAGYLDGRRPTEVHPASPEEDAQRRDFTINGMFYDPLKMEVIDHVNGKADIEKRIIRAIGDPKERFLEDRLRMIRAVRYAARFHFAIEKKTKRAIPVFADTLFPAVAIERVCQEFEKMSRFSNFSQAIAGLHELDLLPQIFPGLRNIPLEEIENRLSLINHFPKDIPLIAYLVELFPSYSLEDRLTLCESLKRPNTEKEFLIYYDRLEKSIKEEQKRFPYDWAHLYANPYFKKAHDLLLSHFDIPERDDLVYSHQKREKTLRPFIERIRNKDPIVKADHLMKMGIKPGPEMGKLLRQAEQLSINENITDPSIVLKQLMKT